MSYAIPDMPLTTLENPPPLFVTVLASAISSIGFGVSVVAIWVVWLLPNAKQPGSEPPAHILRKNDRAARRRSAPPNIHVNPSPPKHTTPPPVLTPISTPSPDGNDSSRRVYFLDSQARHSNPRRFTLPAQLPTIKHSPVPGSPHFSPSSSSSTLASTVATVTSNLTSDILPEESVLESDTSSRRRPSFRLSAMIKTRRKMPTPVPEGYASQSDDPGARPKARRTSTSISIPWSTSRISAEPEQESPSRQSSTSSRLSFRVPGSRIVTSPHPIQRSNSIGSCPSPTIFARKPPPQSPAARTQPYAYPYFATPPTTPTRKPLALVAEKENLTDTERTPRVNDVQERGRDRRIANAKAQSLLGHGRPLSKRRSRSEGWNT